MASDAMREEFEAAYMRQYPVDCQIDRTKFYQDSEGDYQQTIVDVAWVMWQAARRTPAAEVAGSSDSSMPVVAWCDPSNPLNREAFAWPGSLRPATHTGALVLQSDALKAIEEARVEAEKLGNALRLAFDHIDMDTLRVSHCKDAAAIDVAIRSLKESP